MSSGGNQGDRAVGGRADHDFLVEAPEILDRATATRDDQKIGPRDRAIQGQRVEPADGIGNFRGRCLALHRHRPDQNMARKPLTQPMQDVADHRTLRRGDDADHARQKWDRPFA